MCVAWLPNYNILDGKLSVLITRNKAELLPAREHAGVIISVFNNFEIHIK